MLTDEDKCWIGAELERVCKVAKAELAQAHERIQANEMTLMYLFRFAQWNEVRFRVIEAQVSKLEDQT